MGWQARGCCYATESGPALARWATEQGTEQVIAVVRPARAPLRRSGASAWSGLERRRSTTTTCACRSSGFARALAAGDR
jgi:hypothetical protein